MLSSLRALLLALVAFVAAIVCLPAGGGGDTGVWILPQSRPMGAPHSGPCRMQLPRDWRVVTVSKTDMMLKLPPEMGVATSQFIECQTHVTLPTNVVGNAVIIPVQTMAAVLAAPSPGIGEGVIIDANSLGFFVMIRRINATDVRIEIY